MRIREAEGASVNYPNIYLLDKIDLISSYPFIYSLQHIAIPRTPQPTSAGMDPSAISLVNISSSSRLARRTPAARLLDKTRYLRRLPDSYGEGDCQEN